MPNVYDFDQTVIYPDGGYTFFKFCLRRHFFRLLPKLPGTIRGLLRFHVRENKHEVAARGEFYNWLPKLPDWQEEVRLFWEAKAGELLKPWYLAQKRLDDIIISCSPDFLLQPLCDKLGVRLLATRVDESTGSLKGFSCYGAEKVRRLHETYGQIEIGEFYSDSLTDTPLARLAQKAFYVKGDERVAWPETKN